MDIDEIREKYLEEKGREEGKEIGREEGEKKESYRNSKIFTRCFRYRNYSIKNRTISR